MNSVPSRQHGNAWLTLIIVLLLGAMVAAGTWYVDHSKETDTTVSTLRGNLAETQQLSESTSRELSQTKQSFEVHRADSEAAIASRDTTITELKSSLETLGNEKQQLADTSAATAQGLRDQLASANVSLDQAGEANKALQQEKSELQTRIAEDAAIAKTKQEEAVQAITAMQEQKLALEKLLADEQQGRADDAMSSQEEMVKTLDDLSNYRDALKQSAPEHAARLEEWLADVEGLKANVEQLTTKLQQANDATDAAEQELGIRNAELADAQIALTEAKQSHEATRQAAEEQLAATQQAHREALDQAAQAQASSEQAAQQREEELKTAGAAALATAAAVLETAQSDARETQQVMAREADQAMARLREQMTAQAEQAAADKQAMTDKHSTATAALNDTLTATRDQAATDLKLQQEEQARQIEQAAAELAAAKAAAEQAMTTARTDFESQLSATKTAAEQAMTTARSDFEAQLANQQAAALSDREALTAAHSAEVQAAAGRLSANQSAAAAAAERAMIARRNALLNSSALRSVYRHDVDSLRTQLGDVSKRYQTSTSMQRALSEMGAAYTERGLMLTFGEAELSFAPGQNSPTPESIGSLDAVAAFLSNYPSRGVMIEGHTDSLGADAFNQQLSEKRASSVLDALIERGIDTARIRSTGKGESQPIASNATRAGRSKNRRVELIIVDIQALPPLPVVVEETESVDMAEPAAEAAAEPAQ